MTTFFIGSSLNEIGIGAFELCYNLSSFNISASNYDFGVSDGVLFSSYFTTLLSYPRAKAGSSYTIPNSVTSIGLSAFSNSNNLTSITIPNSVISIGQGAFGSTLLTSVTIGNSLTSIAGYAFQYCSNLTSITFTPTSSVTSIGQYAFQGCTSLTSVTIPNSVTSISNYAFAGAGLTTLTIPINVTSIGGYVFQGCTSLATVLCYVAQSAFVGFDAFPTTGSLTIRARSTDSSWTAGTGLTFQGNTDVTVIKNL
jgi:hypothetical protein